MFFCKINKRYVSNGELIKIIPLKQNYFAIMINHFKLIYYFLQWSKRFVLSICNVIEFGRIKENISVVAYFLYLLMMRMIQNVF